MNIDHYEIKEFTTAIEMKDSYALLQELGYVLSLETYLHYLADMISKGYRQIAVLDAGRLIAVSGFWISTKLFCGRYVELDNVVVTASHRSNGIGHLLCNVIEEKARQCGCNTAVLDAYVHNENAHRFYFREGYIIRGFHFLKTLA